MSTPSVFWFRRDLRLGDNPALCAAAENGPVVGVFINDKKLRNPSGSPRLAFLSHSLRYLQRATDDTLVIGTGKPADVLLDICERAGASQVYATADFGPYGTQRDVAVQASLADHGVSVDYLDAPYAVKPGVIVSGAGTFYKVFTPYFRAWKRHGWQAPVQKPTIDWMGLPGTEPLPAAPDTPIELPPAGESAAHDALERFLDGPVHSYNVARDLPAKTGTSHLSVYLKWGAIHPRQILDHLGDSGAEDVFRSELCWREFYADILFQRPDSARHAFVEKMSAMQTDSGPEADRRFEAWCYGRTGFPIVDAGMRQLLATGWMHNRVRMITASFLVKDLHLDWQRGAAWFMKHLIDGDLASNSHGWQWVAGTGTDASPYFRVFNPTTQSKKFDAEGDYIRRWIPELAHIFTKHIHDPAGDPHGAPAGYPVPIVDHKSERIESLARYEQLKQMWAGS